jgi:sialic acid synthase SpsE
MVMIVDNTHNEILVCFVDFSRNHQRALDSMQASLEAESKGKAEAMKIKKKLEQDINELEDKTDQYFIVGIVNNHYHYNSSKYSTLYLYRSLTFNKITGKQILHKKLIIKSTFFN